ncbi:uncharacterized protein MYCGRDRAFT_88038 [Zymoseptoria tritici IPO323]|uniref:RING zinc finger-like domain-containing protein n=1 Tax=Zymoseptoria tritici (strain CBS 115943 / IPO323) TaxID=336722 RepID=F9XN51_ZYMTI|nr:uncharacterized protein MYCGRDRAFT_88038 [Zymoseptoria tritici IPO323]EGP83350.1 hypothetical protein MYCGRDRAFT_88038 [Zymoseptoria tritici IPO323]
MPPRTAANNLTSSFNIADANNEVVCPLRNQDGSNCRKRCLGEKRFRSMQEHIRRAHPEYYIPKLPATKESFELMINTPPHEIPPPQENNNNNNTPNNSTSVLRQLQHTQQLSDPSGYHALGGHDGGYYTAGDAEAAAIFTNMQFQQRSSDEYRRGSLIPAASAAAALAQLHSHRGADSDWPTESMGQQVIFPSLQMSPTVTEADLLQDYYGSNNDLKSNPFHVDPQLEDNSYLHDHSQFQPNSHSDGPAGLISPSDRPSTLPPLQRSLSRGGHSNRPRKSSLSQQARMAKHERKRSKDLIKRSSGGDRKAFSAEPSNNPAFLYGKRWEDLIDAAASATEEEDSRDLTPIPASPYQSPQVASRTSLPPPFGGLGAQFTSFQASPLNRALTPPDANHHSGLDMQTFPSVDDSSLSSNLSHQHHNSADSGSQFQIMNPSSIDSTSSEIYCAGCRRLCSLKEAFACTGCICGLCGVCANAIVSEQSRGRMSMCPRCHVMDSSYKPFALDFR